MPHTLLLADDSVTIQRVIELTFADQDIQVVAVSDGDQAIERLEASPPDIVLADIGMPGKNGYEVAQYIRESPRLAHIPVVLLTGAFEPVDQARAAAAGCDGVLAKPFEPQMVIGRVKELLARSNRMPPSLDGELAAPLALTQEPAPRAADSPFAPAPADSAAGFDGLDDYFDRLDAAFSALTPTAPAAAAPSPSAPPDPAPLSADSDWFGASGDAAPAFETWDLASGADAPASEAWDVPAPPIAVEGTGVPPSYAPHQPAPPLDFDAVPAPAAASAAAPISVAPPPVAPAPPPSPVTPSPPRPVVSATPGASAPATWPPAPAAQAPTSVAAAPPVASSLPVETPAASSVTPERPSTSPAPVAGAASVPAAAPTVAHLPALADAFAAILAAEEHESGSTAMPEWPLAAAAAVVDDQLVEDVTRRVLNRLSDQVLRDTVADIVSRLAERLVRDEIERIKASLK